MGRDFFYDHAMHLTLTVYSYYYNCSYKVVVLLELLRYRYCIILLYVYFLEGFVLPGFRFLNFKAQLLVETSTGQDCRIASTSFGSTFTMVEVMWVFEAEFFGFEFAFCRKSEAKV